MRQETGSRDNEVYLSVVSVWEAVIKHTSENCPCHNHPTFTVPTQREAPFDS